MALLLRVSHRTSLHLLTGYSFEQHIFSARAHSNPNTDSLQRLPPSAGCFRCAAVSQRAQRPPAVDLSVLRLCCLRYSMRIRCLQLPSEFDGPLTDEATGQSLLPPSLAELWLGSHYYSDYWVPNRRLDKQTVWLFSSMELQLGLITPTDMSSVVYSHLLGRRVKGKFNHSLPVGCLPEGLRALYVGPAFNQPLLPGSLPSSLTFCHLGSRFAQPIGVGVLPSQLRDLLLPDVFNQPLVPGVLPASLRRLHMGESYDHPLVVGVLPPQLQWLDLGWCYDHPLSPGVIPSSCTALRLSKKFNQPLHKGCLPDGLQQLDLGQCFNQPLEPGLLPSSLLYFRPSNSVQLPPDVIPPNVIRLNLVSFSTPLVPGSIPPSVRQISVSEERFHEVRELAHPSANLFIEWSDM